MRALAAAVCSLMLAWTAGPASAAAPARAFDVGLVGDWGYEPYQRARLPDVIRDMNAAGLAFSVHDGDFKNGPPLCTDAVYYEARRLFDSFTSPLGLHAGSPRHRRPVPAPAVQRPDALRPMTSPTTAALHRFGRGRPDRRRAGRCIGVPIARL